MPLQLPKSISTATELLDPTLAKDASKFADWWHLHINSLLEEVQAQTANGNLEYADWVNGVKEFASLVIKKVPTASSQIAELVQHTIENLGGAEVKTALMKLSKVAKEAGENATLETFYVATAGIDNATADAIYILNNSNKSKSVAKNPNQILPSSINSAFVAVLMAPPANEDAFKQWWNVQVTRIATEASRQTSIKYIDCVAQLKNLSEQTTKSMPPQYKGLIPSLMEATLNEWGWQSVKESLLQLSQAAEKAANTMYSVSSENESGFSLQSLIKMLGVSNETELTVFAEAKANVNKTMNAALTSIKEKVRSDKEAKNPNKVEREEVLPRGEGAYGAAVGNLETISVRNEFLQNTVEKQMSKVLEKYVDELPATSKLLSANSPLEQIYRKTIKGSNLATSIGHLLLADYEPEENFKILDQIFSLNIPVVYKIGLVEKINALEIDALGNYKKILHEYKEKNLNAMEKLSDFIFTFYTSNKNLMPANDKDLKITFAEWQNSPFEFRLLDKILTHAQITPALCKKLPTSIITELTSPAYKESEAAIAFAGKIMTFIPGKSNVAKGSEQEIPPNFVFSLKPTANTNNSAQATKEPEIADSSKITSVNPVKKEKRVSVLPVSPNSSLAQTINSPTPSPRPRAATLQSNPKLTLQLNDQAAELFLKQAFTDIIVKFAEENHTIEVEPTGESLVEITMSPALTNTFLAWSKNPYDTDAFMKVCQHKDMCYEHDVNLKKMLRGILGRAAFEDSEIAKQFREFVNANYINNVAKSSSPVDAEPQAKPLPSPKPTPAALLTTEATKSPVPDMQTSVNQPQPKPRTFKPPISDKKPDDKTVTPQPGESSKLFGGLIANLKERRMAIEEKQQEGSKPPISDVSSKPSNLPIGAVKLPAVPIPAPKPQAKPNNLQPKGN